MKLFKRTSARRDLKTIYTQHIQCSHKNDLLWMNTLRCDADEWENFSIDSYNCLFQVTFASTHIAQVDGTLRCLGVTHIFCNTLYTNHLKTYYGLRNFDGIELKKMLFNGPSTMTVSTIFRTLFQRIFSTYCNEKCDQLFWSTWVVVDERNDDRNNRKIPLFRVSIIMVKFVPH